MIVCLTAELDKDKIAGRPLGLRFTNNPLRPHDELLRWHFRQAILATVMGA